MKKIICLYGGPGSGKSTTAAGLFFELKSEGINAELNREYIKDWVWEERKIQPGDQTYYFAKMSKKERTYMRAGVDVIITDSPLVLTHFYGKKYDPYEQQFNTSLEMLKQHHAICKDFGYKVDHYILKRRKPYNKAGRLQTENQAKELDNEIEEMLKTLNIKYEVLDCLDPKNYIKEIKNRLLSSNIPFHSISKKE